MGQELKLPRRSAGTLTLSSYGREEALKLELAMVWTSGHCFCQLSTLKRTPVKEIEMPRKQKTQVKEDL